jgi:pimeloyl-ACP methyl ester carboxylesterase
MKADLNGITLAYDDIGSGPAVVLLHGFPLCRKMWQPQVKALATAGYRVITPDLRGFGESEAPNGSHSISIFADDVAGLLTHLGIEKAVIGGMSMGGYVLLNLVERYPHRVAAAMFLVTRAAADDEPARMRRSSLAGEVAAGRPQIVTDAFEGILFAGSTPAVRPELVAEVRTWMTATTSPGLAGGLLAMRDRKDYIDLLPSFELPALVIGAEADRAVPPEHSRLLAEALPNARLCMIAEAGHMANLERPEAFNTCLLEFLHGLGLN